jgi:predicted transcriptional regulator
VVVVGCPLWFEAVVRGCSWWRRLRGYGASISSRAGKTIKEIARELKGARNTVRKVLREETSCECERVVQPRLKLGQWTAELEQLLLTNAVRSAREVLKSNKAERDVEGTFPSP